MKINELRIGDWYLSTKFQVPVICEMGDFYEIYARADGSAEYTVDDIFEPIPLTEEWLLKFGFKEHQFDDKEFQEQNNSDRCFIPENPDDYMYISYGRDSMYCINSYGGIAYIYYVHQLQNLYWCLTGNELTIEK